MKGILTALYPRVAVPLLVALSLSPALLAEETEGLSAPDTKFDLESEPTRWDKLTVSRFEKLPVQQGGRVKPLDTFAKFQLLKLRGTRSARVSYPDPETGEKISVKLGAVEWLLNCLFHPEEAKQYRTFVVDNAEVVTALGVEKHAKRRDRYNYNELLPGRKKLSELWGEARKVEDKTKRTKFQEQVVLLGEQVSEFEYLVNAFNFARSPLVYDAEGIAPETVSALGGTELMASELLEKFPTLREIATAAGGALPDTVSNVLMRFEFDARSAVALTLFPPVDPEDEEWLSPGQILLKSVESEELREWGIPRVAALEALTGAVGDEAAFAAAFHSVENFIVPEAEARGEMKGVEREVTLSKSQAIYRSLMLFMLGFLLLALSWFAPQSGFGRKMRGSTWIASILGLALLVYTIVMRSLIRGMAPITNLYETILFITAFMVLLCLLTEWMTKKNIAIAIAPVLGFAGLFLSILFEGADKSDTINSLPAVLITNFWLSTHVPTINIGYAGCMLAALMSWVYIGGRVFDVRRSRWKQFFRDITRMVYGALAFGMLTSLVGTVLGGIWANDSWGRFWGWDPKENGALMIVLWSLAMLHARMGGYIKELGLHLWSVVLGAIVTFSWFHTNVLGVGLHSYGFSSGIKLGVVTFYAISLVFLTLGIIVWAFARTRKPVSEGSADPGGARRKAAEA